MLTCERYATVSLFRLCRSEKVPVSRAQVQALFHDLRPTDCRYLARSTAFALPRQRRHRLSGALPLRPLQVRVQVLLQLVLPGEHTRADAARERPLACVDPPVPRQVRRPRERQRAKVAGEGLVLGPLGLHQHPRLLPVSNCFLQHLQLPLHRRLQRLLRVLRRLLQNDERLVSSLFKENTPFVILHGILLFYILYLTPYIIILYNIVIMNYCYIIIISLLLLLLLLVPYYFSTLLLLLLYTHFIIMYNYYFYYNLLHNVTQTILWY